MGVLDEALQLPPFSEDITTLPWPSLFDSPLTGWVVSAGLSGTPRGRPGRPYLSNLVSRATTPQAPQMPGTSMPTTSQTAMADVKITVFSSAIVIDVVDHFHTAGALRVKRQKTFVPIIVWLGFDPFRPGSKSHR